jgi:hypothetical protein
MLPTRMRRPSIPGWSLAGLSVIPPGIWWLGWRPGFASSDTIDQWTQLTTEAYFNHHPAIHTFYMDVVSLDGSVPGLVTLLQVLVFGGLMVYGARSLVAAGVPTWLAVGTAWLLGLSPAVAPTTLSLWKDVPFGLFFLWAWIELLALAVDRERVERTTPALRLGLALTGVVLFRANGFLTVLPMIALLAWIYRRPIVFPLKVIGTVIGAWFIVAVPLYAVLDVGGSSIEPATVFLPDVAASYNREPETFTESDLSLLEQVAPLQIWDARYSCYDSTPLVFDRSFDTSAVRSDPDAYRSLELRVLMRDLDSVLEHRLCAANFLYYPPQPHGAYFHRPEYDIPSNEVGLAREPISSLAFEFTDEIWRWAETESILWLTWRPAIVLLPALLSLLLFALVRGARRFWIPGSLFLIHLLNVAATSPAQEFRYAYPLYLTGLLTLTLVWPAVAKARQGNGLET